MNTKTMFRWFLGMGMLVSLLGCRPAQPAAPDQLTFMAGYKPQANLPFVGVYVAQEKGFFAEENLQVDIQHSAGQGQHLQLVAAGEVQVTTQDAGILLQRRSNPGLPLVSIALIGQRGQQAFAALQSTGLKTPQDWAGRTVGYKGSPPPELFALMAANNLTQDDVQLVNVGFDPRILSEGKVDVYPVFKSNEPDMLRSWGYELTLWDPADYGVPSLGLTYVTSQETLDTQPEKLARFLRAALKGIDYASQNLDEAVDIVMKYAGEQADPQHQRFMLETELADYRSPVTEAHGAGWQTEEQWSALAEMLLKYELVKEVNVTGAFTNALLPQSK